MAGVWCQRTLALITQCIHALETDGDPSGVILRLERLERNIDDVSGHLIAHDTAAGIKEQVQDLLAEARKLRNPEEPGTSAYKAPRVPSGKRGNKCCNISLEQLKCLQDQHFNTKEMAQLLGVNYSTVYRRLKANNMLQRSKFARMTEQEIDNLVRPMTSNKLIGGNSILARLKGQGIVLQRKVVRESVRRVDPAGPALRSLMCRPIRHRMYCVPGPNCLWHIDGCHKLIQWKIVIHGGIDGYSHLIVFMQASDNNRPSTLLDSFVKATQAYGVPARVRTDHGGENVDLHPLLALHHGHTNAVIQGASTSNQRIERLWGDVGMNVVSVYRNIFMCMESPCEMGGLGILDRGNIKHLWALHFVFLPRINKALREFIGQWNNHGLRTCHHQTPRKMYVAGMLKKKNTSLGAVQDAFSGRTLQSTLEDLNLPELPDVRRGANIERLPCPLDANQLALLRQTIDPLESRYDGSQENEGMSAVAIYRDVLRFIDDQ